MPAPCRLNQNRNIVFVQGVGVCSGVHQYLRHLVVASPYGSIQDGIAVRVAGVYVRSGSDQSLDCARIAPPNRVVQDGVPFSVPFIGQSGCRFGCWHRGCCRFGSFRRIRLRRRGRFTANRVCECCPRRRGDHRGQDGQRQGGQERDRERGFRNCCQADVHSAILSIPLIPADFGNDLGWADWETPGIGPSPQPAFPPQPRTRLAWKTRKISYDMGRVWIGNGFILPGVLERAGNGAGIPQPIARRGCCPRRSMLLAERPGGRPGSRR